MLKRPRFSPQSWFLCKLFPVFILSVFGFNLFIGKYKNEGGGGSGQQQSFLDKGKRFGRRLVVYLFFSLAFFNFEVERNGEKSHFFFFFKKQFLCASLCAVKKGRKKS